MNVQRDSFLETAEIVRELQQRLATEWRGLTEAEWRGETACTGWTVAHVAAHLAFQADFYASNMSRGLQQLDGPPFVFGPRGAEEYPGFRDGLIDRWTQRTKEDLATEFETRGAVFVELAARLTPAERQMKSWWLRGSMLLGQFLSFRLFELSIHDWDIRSGVDPRAAVRPEILPTLIPLLETRLAQFAGPTPGERAPGTYRLTVKDVAPVDWTITIDDRGLRVAGGGSGRADATITANPSTLALVLAGRQAADQAGKEWQVAGDAAKGAAFGRLFRGF